jgi:hypothetical protein
LPLGPGGYACRIALMATALIIPGSVCTGRPPTLHPAHEPAIRVTDRHLTLRVRNMALSDILTGIGHQAGIEVHFYRPVDERLSITLDNVPVDRAIRLLTRPFNRALVYAETGETGHRARIQAVFIFSGRGATAAHRRHANEGMLLLRDLREGDARARDRAVELLGARVPQEAVLMRGLTEIMLDETDHAVWSRAVLVLGHFRDKRIKLGVIRALGQIGGPEVVAPLENALEDGDEDIRAAAAEVLATVTTFEY